jgi:hypothetical protein
MDFSKQLPSGQFGTPTQQAVEITGNDLPIDESIAQAPARCLYLYCARALRILTLGAVLISILEVLV